MTPKHIAPRAAPVSTVDSRLLKREDTPDISMDEAAMSDLPMEVIEIVGQTMAKVVPVTIALALVFTVLSHFWACNPGKPWWRKRELITDICYWFFVPVFARVFRIGLLVLGAGRRLQHSRCRRADRILRQRPWAAVRASALGAGDTVPRCVRLHAVLAAPHVSRRRLLEISRHPSFLRRISSGFRRRGFIPSTCLSERSWSTSSC